MAEGVRTAPATIVDGIKQLYESSRTVEVLHAGREPDVWSHGELVHLARSFAGALRQLGVRPGDRVALLGSTSSSYLAAILGTWILGAIPAPIGVPTRLTALQQLFSVAEDRCSIIAATLLVVDDRLADSLNVASPRTRTVTFAQLREHSTPAAFASVSPSDTALIQFTSGSTRNPRGAMLSHESIMGNGLAAWQHSGSIVGNTVVSWLPLFHDLGLMGMVVWPLLLGDHARVVLIPPEDFLRTPMSWLHALSDHRGTLTAAPNFVLGLATRLLEASDQPLDLSSVHYFGCGGEQVDVPTVERFLGAAVRHGFSRSAIRPVYGLAEATLAVTAPRPDDNWVVKHVMVDSLSCGATVQEASADQLGHPGLRSIASVGIAVPGVVLSIRSVSGGELGAGIVGRIHVKSDFAMSGYWPGGAVVDPITADGWLYTGDLGFSDGGRLYVTGRADDVMIFAGRNVYPEDIESVVESVAGARKGNAVAFAVPGRERDDLVVAFEIASPEVSLDTLRAQVTDAVAASTGIRPTVALPLSRGTLPKTTSGKRQRSATRMMFLSGGLGGLGAPGHARLGSPASGADSSTGKAE